VKIALAQLNPTIGDVEGNTARVIDALQAAAKLGVELVIFPEQTILGYPAKDLLLRPEIISHNTAALDAVAKHTSGAAALIGVAEPNREAIGRLLYNSAVLLAGGRVVGRWTKRLLPTYDVFDEARYFEPGGLQQPVEFHSVRLGVTICEDMLWQEMRGRPLYRCDPAAESAQAGADVLINISASPYCIDKHAWRIQRLAQDARRHCRPVVYVNQVGGNDELLFDGGSCVLDAEGRVVAQAKSFAEDVLIVDLSDFGGARRERVPGGVAGVHEALVMGLRDYARKCGFRSAVLGLSGGVDSAVVAALAVEALGAGQVHGVAMPSRFSSPHSISDARLLAENLGIGLTIIKIERVHRALEETLAAPLGGQLGELTAENLQARVRGVILMAMSNQTGALLLTTGNKSEVAVGYCTLYGDMCGGLAVISDVPKTMVYQLARHINERSGRSIIPEGSLTKPPSAELRPNQTDQDTLPPYDTLDGILQRFEEQMESAVQISAAGFDARVVADVVRRMQLSEYKRQQMAPGLKVTTRAFGFGRRMPIAARWSAD
jgi:NAD+ synthetase